MIELKKLEMRGLFPTSGVVDLGALVEDLLRSPPPRHGRPYMVCNFISTLDGRATVAGSTERLGFKADARVVMRLRTFADAVMIGAGTMRVERYDRMIPVPRLRGYREQIGLPSDPLTVIVTNRMELPWDAGLFTDGHGKVIIATASSESPPATETELEVWRFEGAVEFPSLLERLASERDVRSLVCEGGPALLGALVAERLIDDLFLTLNPVLVGSGERALIEGTLVAPIPGELLWVLETDGELFTRWRVDEAVRAEDG